MTNLPLTFERPYCSSRYRLINGIGTLLRFVGFPLASFSSFAQSRIGKDT